MYSPKMVFILQRFKESLLVDASASLHVLLLLDVTCNLGILSEFSQYKIYLIFILFINLLN
jgi:hypothetical protein